MSIWVESIVVEKNSGPARSLYSQGFSDDRMTIIENTWFNLSDFWK